MDGIKRTRILALILLASVFSNGIAFAEVGIDQVSFGVISCPTADNREALGKDAPRKNGMFVAGVLPYSCGAAAKLDAFDIITTVNGSDVDTRQKWEDACAKIISGEKVRLDVLPTKSGKRFAWGALKRMTVVAKTSGEDALAAVRRHRDEVSGNSWIFHADSPFKVIKGNDLSLYFSEEGGAASGLHLRLVYTNEDWLFVDSMLLSDGDKVRKEFDLSRASWTRDNSAREVWEWCDLSCTAAICEPLREAILRPEVTLRYQGHTRKQDRVLTPAERARMLTVMNAFKAMGGKLAKK